MSSHVEAFEHHHRAEDADTTFHSFGKDWIEMVDFGVDRWNTFCAYRRPHLVSRGGAG